MSRRAPAVAFAIFIIGYSAVLVWQTDHGVATLDAHGIITAVQRFAAEHELPISRPPGHPTTEIYLFGSIASVLHLLGHTFGERAYLFAQACGALAALLMFRNLLHALGVKRWPAFLAVTALALSAHFFANAVDGEEFDLALFFVFLAVRLLIAEQPIGFLRLFFSIAAFALATGCRLEIIFAAVIYPIYLWCARADLKRVLFTFVSLAATLLLVWSPIILHGVHPPLGAGVTFREAILVGGYKLLFQTFGVPVFLLLLFVLFREVRNLLVRRGENFPRNFLRAVACAIPLLFFALFFRYPTKPVQVLIALPFLLIVATERPIVLAVIAAFTLLDDFVRIDMFKNRHLTSPTLVSGGAIAAVRDKPFYRLPYLRGLTTQCDDQPSAVVGDVWPWDLEYHIRRGSFPAEERIETGQTIPLFVPNSASHCVILPREAAFEPATLERWRSRGYRPKMDALLYETAYARYGTMKADAPRDVALFSIKP